MWSSAAVAHLLQGSTCCAFRYGIMHTLVVTSSYLLPGLITFTYLGALFSETRNMYQ